MFCSKKRYETSIIIKTKHSLSASNISVAMLFHDWFWKKKFFKRPSIFWKFCGLSVAQIKLLTFTNFAVSDHSMPLHSHMYAFDILIQSNLVIRNVLIRNKLVLRLVLRNLFLWPNANLLHKDKELLALRNNFRVTKKFLIAKFDCITLYAVITNVCLKPTLDFRINDQVVY